jgi:Skp family chaperone for outer membrane proteins
MTSVVSSGVRQRWMLVLALGGCLVTGVLMGRNDTRAAEGAAAAPAKGAVVGVVDMFTVLNESRMYKDLKEKLKAGAESKRQEAKRREQAAKEAQEMVEAFKRTAPEFRDKFKAFVDAAVDYNAFVRLSQAEQILLLNKGTWQVYQSILDTIKEVAKANGVELVLYQDDFEPNLQDTEQLLGQIRQRKVLHASEKVDLTQAVLKQFDAKYRKARAAGNGAGQKGG